MCILNQFDFYSVEARADRVGDLVRAGIDRNKCRKQRTGKFKVYGSKCFPVYRWEAVIGYADVCSDKCREQLAELEAKHKGDGVRIYTRYHARD
jgi:hypothetical protein